MLFNKEKEVGSYNRLQRLDLAFAFAQTPFFLILTFYVFFYDAFAFCYPLDNQTCGNNIYDRLGKLKEDYLGRLNQINI